MLAFALIVYHAVLPSAQTGICAILTCAPSGEYLMLKRISEPMALYMRNQTLAATSKRLRIFSIRDWCKTIRTYSPTLTLFSTRKIDESLLADEPNSILYHLHVQAQGLNQIET